MRVKSFKGNVYGADFTAAEKKALNIEVNRLIAERAEEYAADIDAMVLYTLMVHYGWKNKRLKMFWKAFIAEHKALREFYLMDKNGDSEWLSHRMLKEIGVDVNQWYKEEQGHEN